MTGLQVLSKKDLQDRYDQILAKSGLTREQIQCPSEEIILQSSSGVTGEPFLIPRSREDVLDILERCFFAHYRRKYGTLPQRVAMFGGISHAQAALKLKIHGIDIRSFSLEEVDLLDTFEPDMLSAYPSIFRELIEEPSIRLSQLKAVKLGGERIFPADLHKIAERFPGISVMEQLGSTEMPGIATKCHENGVLSTPYILEKGRFSFLFETRDGWQDLIVRDHFPKQLFPIDGFYFIGDEALVVDSRILDVRRKGDVAFNYYPYTDDLLRMGCTNVQWDLANKVLFYSGRIELRNRFSTDTMEFTTVKKTQLKRIHPSNKLPLVISDCQ